MVGNINTYRAYIFGDERGPMIVLGLAQPNGGLPCDRLPSISKDKLSTRGLSVKDIGILELVLHLIAVNHVLKSFVVKHLI